MFAVALPVMFAGTPRAPAMTVAGTMHIDRPGDHDYVGAGVVIARWWWRIVNRAPQDHAGNTDGNADIHVAGMGSRYGHQGTCKQACRYDAFFHVIVLQWVRMDATAHGESIVTCQIPQNVDIWRTDASKSYKQQGIGRILATTAYDCCACCGRGPTPGSPVDQDE